MHRVAIGFALAALALAAACSSSTEPQDESAPIPKEAGVPEGSTPTDAAIATDAADASTPDAALPPGHGAKIETSKTALSCDAVCAAKSFTCGSTKCESIPGALGVAAYLGGADVNVASCADVPAATNAGAKLVRVDCCCVTPFVLVTGPTPAKSCQEVCSGQSLACDDTHDWGAPGKGGLDAQYERPSTTAVTDYALPCAKAPPATMALTKPTEKGPLTKYTCACVAP